MKNYNLTFEGKTLTSIGNEKNVIIPKHITEISTLCRESFMFHEQIETIVVEQGNPVFHSNGNCLINTKSRELVLGCRNSVIPDDGSVERIGTLAFATVGKDINGKPDGSFTTINIPKTVVYIGPSAFVDSGITTIKLPESLIAIDSYAFANTELKSLFIPKSVEILGHSILRNTNITKIKVSYENINYYSQNNCVIERKSKMLVACSKNAIIHNGVKSIDKLVLSIFNHDALITVPESVKEIKEFEGIDMPSTIEFPITLRVKSGSYAHEFANKKGIKFEIY